MYYIKSSRVGKAKPVPTIEEVLVEVERILQGREALLMYGKITIERR